MESAPPDILSWAFWFKDSTSVRDLLISLVAITGIPFLIWRELSTHRSAKAALAQSEAAAEQVRIATRQAEIAVERHEQQTKAELTRRITDSFAKAVELLGSDKLEARLGAIYALERIARDSKEDHWAIMETLASYISSRFPIKNRHKNYHYFDKNLFGEEEEKEEEIHRNANIRLPADVQAALTVLCRRKKEYDHEDENIVLRDTDFTMIDLSRVDMRNFDLFSSEMKGVSLSGANMHGAKMIGVNLHKADLVDAKLGASCLSFATLTEAFLHRADLRLADLSCANLAGAILNKADLRGANLSAADLSGADLTKANLSGIKFTDTTMPDFTGAKFSNTIMPDGTLKNPEPAL